MQQTTQDSATDLQTEIAMRAYQIYQRRGAEHGSDLDDWLQAERELNELPAIVRGASAA